MIICKDFNPQQLIITIDDWKRLCPPKKKDEHWKDGRSAKETAKHWVKGPPIEFQSLFKPVGLQIEYVSPERITKFDDLGEGRHHDLLITGTIANGESVIISVESKVDEGFGNESVGDYFLSSKKKNENTKVPERIVRLKEALFISPNSKSLDNLGYQLLTAIAGTIAEAHENVKKVFFIVQTFLTKEMVSKKHRENEMALDYFVHLITNGKTKIIHDGDLIGAIRVPGNKGKILNDIDLYIGKYSIKI